MDKHTRPGYGLQDSWGLSHLQGVGAASVPHKSALKPLGAQEALFINAGLPQAFYTTPCGVVFLGPSLNTTSTPRDSHLFFSSQGLSPKLKTCSSDHPQFCPSLLGGPQRLTHMYRLQTAFHPPP